MDLNVLLNKIATEIGATLKEKNGLYNLEVSIAERKAFLARKKLTYKASFRIDSANKILHFSEMLKESGFGFTSSGDDMSPGFGFKVETYNTLGKARTGTIEEQSNLFGKKYQYKFDYKSIRQKIEKLSKDLGYKFAYQILPVK
jgi:hypothetical protein